MVNDFSVPELEHVSMWVTFSERIITPRKLVVVVGVAQNRVS